MALINNRALAIAAALGLGSTGEASALQTPDGCAPAPGPAARVRPADPSTLKAVLATAHPGDVVRLSAGAYGAVVLKGANAGFVTVEGPGDHGATLSALTIIGRNWDVRGLTIAGLSSPALAGQWPSHQPLVKIEAEDNVILADNVIASRLGAFPWRAETPGTPDATPLSNGVSARNVACVTIEGNRISNVFNGVSVDGDQVGDRGKHFRITGNTIDNFAGDGIDHGVSDALISGNLITNSHNICENKCIHTDGIQGWNYNDRQGIVNENVVIDGNTIIQQAKPDLPLPADDLHGITIFDGFWKNVRITNNIIVTDTYHGIALGGIDGLLVANNTVVGTSDRRTWILAGARTHEGGVSRNVTVINNIAVAVRPAPALGPGDNARFDHNFILKDPAATFVVFDPKAGRFDLRLRRGSAARGVATAEGAPERDIDGAQRTAPLNPGAYR